MLKFNLLFILLTTQLFAQTLSLEDAIKRAIDTHPDIKRFVLQVQKSQIGVDGARADYLPQVNLYGEYNPIKTYVFPINGTFNTIQNDGYLFSVNLHQKIWDFSKTTSNIDAQKENTEIAKYSLDDAKSYLAYKVKLQYGLILVQRAALKVRQKDLEVKDELYKQAQAFVDQGMKTSADETRFLSSFYIAKDNLAIAQANFDKARSTLSIYIDEEIQSDIELEGIVKNNQSYDENNIINNSPSLKALGVNVQKNRYEYKSVRASHYGSINAIASYSFQNSLNEYDSSIIGITLDIPLYSGGRISALEEQAQINKQNSQIEYDSKLLALKDEIRSTIIDINRYEKTILAKKAQLNVANSTSDLLDARYKEGLSTYIEVLDASALNLDAQLGLLNAQYELSCAIYKLEYLEGK